MKDGVVYGVVVKRTNMVELTEVVVVNWLT